MEKGCTHTPAKSFYHSLQDWITKMNNWLQKRRDWTNKHTNIHAIKNLGFATACDWNCHKMLQDLQTQVITRKAQFPLVPDAMLECQAWPGVELSAMGVSRSTKEWEIAKTGLPWSQLKDCSDAGYPPSTQARLVFHMTLLTAEGLKWCWLPSVPCVWMTVRNTDIYIMREACKAVAKLNTSLKESDL